MIIRNTKQTGPTSYPIDPCGPLAQLPIAALRSALDIGEKPVENVVVVVRSVDKLVRIAMHVRT